MTTDPTQDEASIRAARAHSNRSITRRNLLGVGHSLSENFVAIIGDGTFVPSRAAYLKLFKQGFDAPKTSLTYERVPDTVQVSAASPLSAEQGHWIATDANGKVAYTGTYMAMWERTNDAWKIRSELYVNLSHH
jgi:ketosteroid isomerase-like protein